MLYVQPAFERILQPFARNLERLGVAVTLRVVDASQYERRMETFDFDMTVEVFGQSRSPGNEQRDYWTGARAEIEGSRNTVGIADEVVDALVEALVYADSREALIAACRALDRVLRWGHYIVPNWHIRYDRLAYWDIFGRPETTPEDGFVFSAWWIDAEREAALKARLEAGGG